MEFIKDQYRHCKAILALGASQMLLARAGLPVALDKAQSQGNTGVFFADAAEAATAAVAFIGAVGRHRHFGRETDPPML
jgi:catalase